MRKIVNLLFLLSYLNILTLLPGSCAAFAPKLDACEQICIGENTFDDYESIWEMLLTDVLEQKDVQYQSDDFPVSAHISAKNAFASSFRFEFIEPIYPSFNFAESTSFVIKKNSVLPIDSKNAFAQYHDYLFRLTPF